MYLITSTRYVYIHMKRKHITKAVLYLILASAAPPTRGDKRTRVAMEALSLRHVFAILLLWRAAGSNALGAHRLCCSKTSYAPIPDS